MKTFLIAAALSCAVAPAALAADAVYQPAEAPVAGEAVSFSWTGFTIGVQGGYNWNNGDFVVGGVPGTFSGDFDGGILGGFVGYNYQFGNDWVVGVEGDLEHNWADGTTAVGAVNFRTGLDWQGSIRGRVGYSFDRALLYGTAGWAFARAEAEFPPLGSDKANLNGFTIGAGLDYAFTDMFFGRLEYRYTNFGDQDFSFSGLGGSGTVNSDFDQHAVRVGLGVKF